MEFYIKKTTIRTIEELMIKFRMLRADSTTDFERQYAIHEFNKWLKDEGYNKVDGNSALSRFNDLSSSIIIETEKIKIQVSEIKDKLIENPNNWAHIGTLNKILTLLQEI